MDTYTDDEKNIKIKASKIQIDEGVNFGSNIDISIAGELNVGPYSNLGSDLQIKGNNVSIGEHFYHSRGLRIGGGGSDYPTSNIVIGARCVMHNNFLNVYRESSIGDDVGLSPEVAFITHGFWQSVLEGFPYKFASIQIGSGVIIGYRSIVMPGVNIANDCVIGAHSNIVKTIDRKGIYGGNPAKFIAEISNKTEAEKNELARKIVLEYVEVAQFHGVAGLSTLKLEFPYLYFRSMKIDLVEQSFTGEEDRDTDDLRDFLRKWGIRLYSPRGFRSRSKR